MEHEIFVRYINELQTYLFEDTKLQDIIKSAKLSHRKNRFLSLYVLKNEKIFYELYSMQSEYGLEDIFSKVLTALFNQDQHAKLKQHFIRCLNVREELAKESSTLYQVKEFNKDLANFEIWRRKGQYG